MDLISNQQPMKCIRHAKNEIIYIQVNEMEDNKSIFYCETCVSIDYNFKPQNYVRIKQVLESNDESTVYSWPPLNDNLLQQQLIQLTTKDQLETFSLSNEIKKYFEDLKSQLLYKINESYRKAINLVQEFPKIEKQIILEYQKISKISKFKELLLDKNSSILQKEQYMRRFINEFLLQKERNSLQFQHIFNEKDKLKQAINLDALDQIRKQILSIIDQYFESNVFSLQEFNNNLQSLKQIQKVKASQSVEEQIQVENKQIIINNNNLPIQKEDFLHKLNFIQSIYCENKYDQVKIVKNQFNNHIEFTPFNIKIGWSGCYYTNIILDKYKEYTFRFKAQQRSNERKAEIQFGLVSNAQYDKFFPYDNLSCILQYQDNKVSISEINQAISKTVKGDFKNLSINKEFQLRVNINQGILELSDLPEQNHIAVLLDKFQSNLTSYQNLRFFMQLNCYAIVTLTTALKS